mmetsp:Transcript_23440/g.67352  ORF Transcript_23440/g.67352 Transcript_23440/m.67352 type:complete len:200 (-) Transcript_23440:4-603(-)
MPFHPLHPCHLSAPLALSTCNTQHDSSRRVKTNQPTSTRLCQFLLSCHPSLAQGTVQHESPHIHTHTHTHKERKREIHMGVTHLAPATHNTQTPGQRHHTFAALPPVPSCLAEHHTHAHTHPHTHTRKPSTKRQAACLPDLLCTGGNLYTAGETSAARRVHTDIHTHTHTRTGNPSSHDHENVKRSEWRGRHAGAGDRG